MTLSVPNDPIASLQPESGECMWGRIKTRGQMIMGQREKEQAAVDVTGQLFDLWNTNTDNRHGTNTDNNL